MEVSKETGESGFTETEVENLPLERVISTSRRGNLSPFSISEVKEMLECWRLTKLKANNCNNEKTNKELYPTGTRLSILYSN